jgi:hypothetical protein
MRSRLTRSHREQQFTWKNEPSLMANIPPSHFSFFLRFLVAPGLIVFEHQSSIISITTMSTATKNDEPDILSTAPVGASSPVVQPTTSKKTSGGKR